MNLKALLKCCLIILITLIGISGCWDRRELESLGLIQALGLDLSPDGKGIIVTTMIAIPPRISGAGGGQSGRGGGVGTESGVFTISMSAPTIYEGFNLINTTINREVTLIQNAALLIGEDLAKQGVHQWIDTLVRFREMRRTMLIFVCRGKAMEIMKVQPILEKNPSEYFTNLAKLTYRHGMYPMVTLNSFMNSFEAIAQENYAPILARFEPMEPTPARANEKGALNPSPREDSKSDQKPTRGEENIRIIGTAIFKKDKQVGTFDIYESQVLQLLTGQLREALLTVSDPIKKGQFVAYRLLATNPPRIKYIHRRGDRFTINLKLEADILSIQSGINYSMPTKETILGKRIAQELKRRIVKVITKAQNEYAADVFGFGKTVQGSFLTSPAWDKYHWPDRFPTAKMRVNVKVMIRRVGVQFQPPQLR
jgi:spore germination protein KC